MPALTSMLHLEGVSNITFYLYEGLSYVSGKIHPFLRALTSGVPAASLLLPHAVKTLNSRRHRLTNRLPQEKENTVLLEPLNPHALRQGVQCLSANQKPIIHINKQLRA